MQISLNFYTWSGTIKERQSLISDLNNFSFLVLLPFFTWKEGESMFYGCILSFFVIIKGEHCNWTFHLAVHTDLFWFDVPSLNLTNHDILFILGNQSQFNTMSSTHGSVSTPQNFNTTTSHGSMTSPQGFNTMSSQGSATSPQGFNTMSSQGSATSPQGFNTLGSNQSYQTQSHEKYHTMGSSGSHDRFGTMGSQNFNTMNSNQQFNTMGSQNGSLHVDTSQRSMHSGPSSAGR
jgi:hypothetical protein